MDLFAATWIFTRVVDTGGFSAMARERRTTQPKSSKPVAWLEDHLRA